MPRTSSTGTATLLKVANFQFCEIATSNVSTSAKLQINKIERGNISKVANSQFCDLANSNISKSTTPQKYNIGRLPIMENQRWFSN